MGPGVVSPAGVKVVISHQAKKKRKLYNGMIKCDLFMYGNV